MTHYETLISVPELRANLGRLGWSVIDCRFDLMRPRQGRQEHAAGHIPGAHHADLERDLSGPVTPQSGRHPLPDPLRLGETLGSWGITGDSQVVVYDQAGGAMAARLWWLLRWLGHRRVALLDGGIDAWRRQGGELESLPPPFQDLRYTGAADAAMVLGTAELAGDLASWLLIDARERPRFLGRVEPIDRVAGHIPGARNLPFAESLGPQGRFRPRAELEALWAPLLGDAGPGEWAVMCGSGVTACHLALSAKVAGFPPPRLYAGSWSEWIRDPARPVAGEPG